MHDQVCRWVEDHLAGFGHCEVVEYGARDVNGTIHPTLCRVLAGYDYTGVDIEAGSNVDVIADAAVYRHSSKADVVLCLEVFEHIPHWRDLILSAYDNLRSGGVFVATCAGPKRGRHSGRSAGPLEPGEWYENPTVDAVSERLKSGWVESVVAETRNGLDIGVYAVKE